MNFLSNKVQKLKPSPTLALAAMAKKLKSEGKDVISLSVGEPDWDTFQSIKDAAKRAMDEGATKYTPSAGVPALREAICLQTNEDFNMDYNAEDVTVSAGGKFIIYSLLQSVLNPGDEVVIPAPYWVSYPAMVELADGVPVIVQTQPTSGFKVTVDDLDKVVTEKTKLVIFNSPSNPTGQVYTRDEMKAIGEFFCKKAPHVLIMSDDIYNRLVFEDQLAPHILHSCPELKNRVVCVNGVAKTYSMTGWRVGWAVGPAAIIGAMSRIQSQSVSCASSISQAAALEAVTNSAADIKEAVKKLHQRRDFAFEKLRSLPGIDVELPGGAFYMWPNVSSYFGKTFAGKTLSGSKEFAEALLDSEMVAAVPGAEFGVEGYLRLSYAISNERMSEAVDRIARFLSQLS